VVALRVELSATRLSAACGQPALDYRSLCVSRKSGWQDSNLRLRAPKARGFAATLHPEVFSCSTFSDPYRSRTGLAALKGRCPQTDRRTGQVGAYFPRSRRSGFARTFHAVGRAVLESASAAFQAAATPSQLPTQQKQKKPDVVVTPGFRYSFGICAAECHIRNGYDGHRFAV
jgi:hypothetical protein